MKLRKNHQSSYSIELLRVPIADADVSASLATCLDNRMKTSLGKYLLGMHIFGRFLLNLKIILLHKNFKSC